MNTVKVYDLPTRIFHWLFAILFIYSFAIANLIDDESTLFVYHKLSGILMIFLVVMRIIWGVFGSKYAKFSSFKLTPSSLLSYFNSILSSKSTRYLGHNPASSYASILMFMFAIFLGVTGILMSKGINKELFEEIHELCANGFFITVIIHIVGVIFHQNKHKDGMIYSMINGKKESIKDKKGISSNHNFTAIIFVATIISFATYLNHNYDSNNHILKLFGNKLSLGEDDHDEHNYKNKGHSEYDYDNNEDDD